MNGIDDVLIVGSGVAGALLAAELAAAGLSVHLLEAGGAVERSAAVEKMRSSVDRNLHSPFPRFPWLSAPDGTTENPYFDGATPERYRPSFLKCVGGTTWHWTGMTPRFLPEDFEMRSKYGVGENWPISYRELEPWYVKAEAALGVAGSSDDDLGSPRSQAYPMEPVPLPYGDRLLARRFGKQGWPVKPMPAARNTREYADRARCCGANSCTPICPSGAQYSAAIDVARGVGSGARLTTQAVAYRLEVDGEKRISAVHYKHPDGSSHAARARMVVLACNTVETARLLLMSAGEHAPQGVANSSDGVGRYLMDHLLLQIEFRCSEPLYAGRGPQSVSLIDRGRSGAFRRRHGAAKLFIGNSPNIQMEAARLLADHGNWPTLIGQLRDFTMHYGCVGGEIEVLPQASNRLQLDRQRKDPLGLPLPRIDYHPGKYALQGAGKWQEQLTLLLNRTGAKQIAPTLAWSSHHPSGTARMGDRAKDSVVNRDGRSHDHANLFVAGAALFPSMGTANPTLTVAALSLRLADHLKGLFVAK